jgi:hypothetical protein
MNRRSLLKTAAFVPAAYMGARSAPLLAEQRSASPSARVRPPDANWPDEASWAELDRDVGGRLVKLASPLDAWRREPDGAACREVFRELKNPYYIGAGLSGPGIDPSRGLGEKRYDPTGLFFVHHGVGSEDWSADGFTRLA